MRPRKTILLYCPNTVIRDLHLFQMDLWHFRVTCAGLDEMVDALVRQEYDLVLLRLTSEEKKWKHFAVVASALEKLQLARRRTIRIYDTSKTLPDDVVPTIYRIPAGPLGVEFFRETLKTVVARKRGPFRRQRDVCPPSAQAEKVKAA
jgi:hypothetical protein